MKDFNIEKYADIYVYSAFVNGVFKITTSDKVLSFTELVEKFKEA